MTENFFDQYDSIEPPQPEAPANQPPAPLTPVQNMPGVSVIEDAEMREFLGHFSAQNIREGTDKLNDSRGRSFVDGLTTFLQYEAELIKGITPGAIGGVGTALHGGAAAKAAAEVNVGDFARERLAVLDSLDRGEMVKPRFGDLTNAASSRDVMGYLALTPAQRATMRHWSDRRSVA